LKAYDADAAVDEYVHEFTRGKRRQIGSFLLYSPGAIDSGVHALRHDDLEDSRDRCGVVRSSWSD
jgi:hypothetical protein